MPLTDGDREELIRAAIKSAANKNITLGIQSWGIEWNKTKDRWIPKKGQTCCALGCTILEYQDKLQPRIHNWRQITLERILDTDTEWVRSFQLGYDGYPRSGCDEGSFAYDLGSMMREELVEQGQLTLSNIK